MNLLTGIGGSKGYSSGSAIMKTSAELVLAKRAVSDHAAEIARFRAAQDAYEARLSKLAIETARSVGPEAAGIFEAYKVIVRDEAFFKNAFDRVENESVNIEYAVRVECEEVTAHFEPMDDDYMKERATDIENVCDELINIMMGISNDFSHKMSGQTDVILVAEDLTPAETVKIDKSVLRGIVTERGGVTSHTVILAKAMGITAIVGVKGALDAIRDGMFLQLDAFKGEVTIDPDDESKKAFAAFKAQFDRQNKLFELARRSPAVTKDGFAVDVRINSGDPDSIRNFDARFCDGIGLFRTEFIYMNASSYPGEEEQFGIYKNIAIRAGGKEVIIRTLDIGGDKEVPYMNLPPEKNPFLGYRAIRLCLDQKDIFATQLRAILRASAFGNIKIMFPMIVNVEELLEAKACVEAEKQKLREEGITFREDIPIGIMVETPAAVLLSDKLARESAFFSIGSNDLIQHTVAADRTNERIQHLHDNCNLSVLRGIHMVAANAAGAGIPWGICGEVASEERLVPLWVAMGVRELSVAPTKVGAIKHLINSMSREDIRRELDVVLEYDRIEDVKTHLDALLVKMI